MVEGVRARGIGSTAPPARDGTKTAEGGFVVDSGAEPLSQKPRLSATATLGLENLLALQEFGAPTERDRRARERGSAMIAALTNLQRLTLAEANPAEALGALNELASADSVTDDPELGAILRAIVLRSRIEIARRAHRG
jgi:hypothetical protein